MQIRDVMTAEMEAVGPSYTVEMAAQIMADLDRQWVPVIEDELPVGTLTGREIAVRVVAEGLDPKQTTVGTAMSGDALYCFENEPASDVAQKMADWWVRCLPVVDRSKRPGGLVSLAQLQEPRTGLRSRKPSIPPRQSRARRPARQGRLHQKRPAAAWQS